MTRRLMTKLLVSRFDKKLIPALPKVQFEGRIEIVRSELEAHKAVDYLLTQPALGFDTETRPSFTRGKSYRVALLQVCSREICFLFRLDMIGLSESIQRLLTDTTVTKVGLSWNDDIRSLRRRGDFDCAPFVELQQMCRELGIKDMSLQKLYANVFGQRISKTQQLSNWEVENYSEPQKRYAATDAWACLMLYEEFRRLKDTGDFELEIIPEPEPPQYEPKLEVEKQKSKKATSRTNKKPSGKRRKTGATPKESINESVPKEKRTRKKTTSKSKNNEHQLVS